MTDTHPDLALLTPVPLEHLLDSLPICEREGKVAFGSNAWELFDHRLEQLREGRPVEALIYASHSFPDLGNVVSWKGIYERYVHSVGGAHPDGMKFRSPISEPEDSSKFWGGFWEVAKLQRLESTDYIPILQLKGWQQQRHYKSSFVPEGPLIIERPT